MVGITTFKTEEEALAIANDTEYMVGRCAGPVIPTALIAWRGAFKSVIWMNCYHAYPTHAAFGGYKKSGIGREGQ